MAPSEAPQKPELFFGLVGPIGVDLDCVQKELIIELNNVGYEGVIIQITDIMRVVETGVEISEESFFEKIKSKINYANEVCKKAGSTHALAALTVARIRKLRRDISGKEDIPALGRAFIIRQFKRPSEIELMRKIYGRKFIQISVAAPETDRREILLSRIKEFDDTSREKEECEKEAIDLIRIDHNEHDQDYGQRMSSVFHLGDVFVDGTDKNIIKNTINRFVQAFFGFNGVSPTKDEYGLYAAAAASLRSIDLSRQVGASIFTKNGEIVAQGCNEVPKAFGGTYWDNDGTAAQRDFDRNGDANHSKRRQLLSDIIQRMADAGFLSDKVIALESSRERFRLIVGNERIKDSQVMDIIEFGRMIHAEMSAITDAARIGISVKNCTMFCTTFPCHMCAKHIVSSGIDRLVYLEPYPKSYATELHSDSITFDKTNDKMVIFEPFIGISPRRYRDIFEKRDRKDKAGRVKQWYKGEPFPMLEDTSASYVGTSEETAIMLIKKFETDNR